ALRRQRLEEDCGLARGARPSPAFRFRRASRAQGNRLPVHQSLFLRVPPAIPIQNLGQCSIPVKSPIASKKKAESCTRWGRQSHGRQKYLPPSPITERPSQSLKAFYFWSGATSL